MSTYISSHVALAYDHKKPGVVAVRFLSSLASANSSGDQLAIDNPNAEIFVCEVLAVKKRSQHVDTREAGK